MYIDIVKNLVWVARRQISSIFDNYHMTVAWYHFAFLFFEYDLYIFVWLQYFWGPSFNYVISKIVLQ